jgi:hypothetical protein
MKNSNPVGGQNQSWAFGNTVTKTQTRSITQQTTQIVGADVSVSVSAEVGIPLIASVSTSITIGAHWETQSMQSTTTSDTTTYSFSISQSSTTNGPLEPQHAIHCTVNTFNSNYDTQYTATVRTTMSNGKTFDIRQLGKLVSVLYTDSIQDCKTVPIKDVPAGTHVTEGSNISQSESTKPKHVLPAPSPKASALPAVLKRAVAFQG